MLEQENIWKEHTSSMTVDSIIDSYHNPAIFQKELSDYLNKMLNGKGKAIEVGCEQGITSFLLDCEERCFFDFNEDILEKDREAHKILQPERIKDTFVQGDMFDMPFADNTFDIVFNAGVLEHYQSDEIVHALKEMGRISKGKIVVAIPNHFCIVYRSAYLFGMLLDRLKIKKWVYPPEHKFYDLCEEIERAGLILEKRIVMSKKSIWIWWGGKKVYPNPGYVSCN